MSKHTKTIRVPVLTKEQRRMIHAHAMKNTDISMSTTAARLHSIKALSTSEPHKR